MNLVSFLISTGINLLYIPFPDSTSEPATGRRVRSEQDAISMFPFNILRNTPACLTRSVLFGKYHQKVSYLFIYYLYQTIFSNMTKHIKITRQRYIRCLVSYSEEKVWCNYFRKTPCTIKCHYHFNQNQYGIPKTKQNQVDVINIKICIYNIKKN